MQFDIGPPTLVTGMLTRGRGDGGRKHWVTRFRVSYSNDSRVWVYYKDAEHLEAKVSQWLLYAIITHYLQQALKCAVESGVHFSIFAITESK